LNLQFQYEKFLLLLAALVVFALLFFLLVKWKKKAVRKIGDEKLVKQLIRNFSSASFNLKFILFSLAFAAGVVAAANLRKPGSADSVSRKGIDVMVALDVSRSMLATDLSPNRLEKAKQMIYRLMDQMPNDRIGLVLFAGKAYLQMPLTTDHNAAAIFVSSAGPDAVPTQGTVISEALQLSSHMFNPKEQRFKTIVLISDGEDHDMDAMETAKDLSQQGIMICTIGVGSAEGAQIYDPVTGDYKKDAMGNVVISKLNEDELKQLASATNGKYVHFDNVEQAVSDLMQQLNQVEKKTFTDVSLLNYKTYYGWFAGAMFILLIAELLISERKRKPA
jgi:Ca-activated chloride channel family protein